MTDKLEKQFFDTFGIEPKRGIELTIDPTTDDNVMNEHKVCYGYPQITDRILLELICIVNTYLDEGFWAENLTELKEEVLNNCLLAVNTTDYGVAGYEEKFKHQVQALFEEG